MSLVRTIAHKISPYLAFGGEHVVKSEKMTHCFRLSQQYIYEDSFDHHKHK